MVLFRTKSANHSDLFVQALVVQLSPKEAVVVAGDSTPDCSKVKEVLTRSGLLITERKKCTVTILYRAFGGYYSL